MNYSSIKIMTQLIRADFALLKQGLPDKLINLAIYLGISLFVPVYLLPSFGINAIFARFSLAGAIATAGLFEVFPGVTNLVSDFEGENITGYYLTLPIPSWFVFIRSMLSFSLNGLLLTLYSIPICFALVWQKFNPADINVGKLAAIILITALFYGAFAIWITSFVKNLLTIEHVWMRFVFPLWFLGGFQFTWLALKDFYAPLAYINLLNPMLYVLEGTRAAMLGQQGYISYALCITALGAWTVFCIWHGIIRLKKRLDFV